MDSILLNLQNMPLLSFIPHTLAYIDPGTGSIILQAIAAAIAGAAIIVRIYWHRLLRFFGLRKNIKPDPSNKQDDQDD